MLKVVDVPLFVTMGIDPAVTDQAYSNATGITIVGEDQNGNWYILEADPFKGQPSDVVDRVAYYAQRYRPTICSCEIIAAQRLYLPMFRERFEALGLDTAIREYRYSTRLSKNVRIEALQPKFKQKKVYLRRGLDELVRQLRQFPETEEDDLLDALSQHLTTSRPFNPKDAARIRDDDEVWADEDDIAAMEHKRNNGTWVGKGTTRYGR